MFHKNGIGPIIRTNGTIFESILYLNSARVYIRLIYVYPVISVNNKRLPGNTKTWTLVRSWLIRVRLVHSWAAIYIYENNIHLWNQNTLIKIRYIYPNNIHLWKQYIFMKPIYVYQNSIHSWKQYTFIKTI